MFHKVEFTTSYFYTDPYDFSWDLDRPQFYNPYISCLVSNNKQ